MEPFSEYVTKLDNQQRERMEEILAWVGDHYPQLQPKIAWNQPMFTDHDTYIIGFSAAKQHLSVAPEQAGITRFLEEIVQAGYSHTKELVRFRWNQPFDYGLLKKLIDYNIEDKAGCTTFWR